MVPPVMICSFILMLPVLVTSQPGTPIFVSTPNVMRVGNEETVLISVYNTEMVEVTVSLKNGDGSLIISQRCNVDPDNPQIVRLNVDPGLIPVIENDDNLKRYAVVAVSCPALGYEDEKEVLLSFQQGYLFIQTDKPIYTPSQTVNIRLINLDQYMTPASQKIQLDIRTPQNITVKREIFEPEDVNGFLADSFKFPEEPMFGNWSLVAHYGKDMAVNTSVQFEVKEYVLPTFSVKIQPPEYILKTVDEISISVSVRYVYDKPVQGRAFFKVGILGTDGSIVISHSRGVLVQDGFGQVDIIPGEVFGDNWFDDNLECRLYVEVTVVETVTGHFENSTDTSAKFVNSPYTFSWKRTVPYFKRGPYVVKTDLTKVNGQPAGRVPVSVSAIATLTDGSQLPLVGEIVNGQRQPSEKTTNAKGQVDFRLYVTPECESIAVQLTTVQVDLVIVGDELGSNANLEFNLLEFESANGNDFLVIRSSVENIMPGDDLDVDVFIASTDVIPHLSYFVVARGQIMHADILNRRIGNVEGFTIRVDYNMIPSARVVAYFINQAGQVIADSFWMEVERMCENQVTVTPVDPDDPRENNRIDTTEPSAGIKLKLAATPGTRVGLLAVDKAVYLLRDFHRLTRDKMYKRMDMQDTGCGPGSGRNSEGVFKNAGLTVLTNLNQFDVVRREELYCSTPMNGRKRRSLASQREEYARDGGSDLACKRGHRLLGDGLSCSDRATRFLVLARIRLGNLSPERENYLSEVFRNCCIEAEAQINRGRANNVDLSDPEFIKDTPDDVNFRTDFRETWFFETVEIGAQGLAERDYTVPGSITEWSIQAVGLSNLFAMCVLEPVDLLVRSDFFIQLRMPYSVVRMEQVELMVTVFNYRGNILAVRMFIETTDKVCSEGTPGRFSAEKVFQVQPNNAFTVTYVVIGLEIGEHPIRIVALTAASSDGVSKLLKVVPEGVERSFQHSTLLNPLAVRTRQADVENDEGNLECEGMLHIDGHQRNCLDISLPDDAIPDSQSCHVSVTGNLLGPVVYSIISGLESLIRLPTGCGEQTMLSLGPDVYVLRYLLNTNADEVPIEDTAKAHIRSGIIREQTYRRSDGAYSAWGNSRGASTWLTAFVAKVFSQASEYVFVDPPLICSALKWMIDTVQRADGAFEERLAVIHREMSGGVQGDASLTAYVLITLSESNCEQHSAVITASANRAMRFLEGQLNVLERPYAVAIVTYALALAGSERRNDANTLLRSLVTHNEVTNSRFWGADASSLAANSRPYWYQSKPSAISVETTGYALLAQLALGEISYSHAIVKWLTEQQNYGGGFTSTQDTVIALQALSEYAILNEGGDLNMDCTVSVHDTEYKTDFHFENDIAFIQQQAVIPQDFIAGKLIVNTTGEGIGKLNVEVKYNVPSTELEDCAFSVDVEVVRDDGRDGAFELEDTITVRLCTAYLGEGQTSMAILDIGLYTGFNADEASLDKLVEDDGLIQRYEFSQRSVILYADHIPNDSENMPLCVTFKAKCEFVVRNLQQVAVTVYDYYKPDDQCTVFHTPPNTAELQTICEGPICACVTGQCADCNPRYTAEELMEKGCETASTYVYMITITDVDDEGGFKKYNATIAEVIKIGNDVEILRFQSRQFWTSSACDCPKFIIAKTFLIISGNALEYVNAEGEKGFKYIVDKTTVVYRWTKKNRRKYEDTIANIQNGRGNCG